ncbi:helix-turn-helix transcriptional regulator [Gluconacetobacter sp. 1b LMG 1731]|uniref:Helix-turn-helix transcriptional regulator n=1 Tax=Gluconacetobacter dulcium TaxID=2729096 RepID=A0A7W4NW65_9PROT|nr:helix-turn-helix transcriptional regulator [Gluconacetobacter dulcium]MBB2165165.1 helix-turn-helix transcriptional regulator [Gluconacetobacter dulcium]MBB2194209.1 helix-turn-helix transcriptional regulator [Gluconacetobacter dulcium]
MIRHDDLWRALDTLAAERGLTPSGLARAAGLDPTSFNPSKRITAAGRPRWPGTESLARVLDITGLSLEAFARLATGHHPLSSSPRAGARSRLRLSPFSHLDHPGMFDGTGLPSGRHWDQWDMPTATETDLYAVTLDTDLFEPVFRVGTILTVSPAIPIRRRDRVLVLRPEGPLCAVVVDPRRGAGTGPLLAMIGTSAGGGAFEADPTDHLHRIMMAFL